MNLGEDIFRRDVWEGVLGKVYGGFIGNIYGRGVFRRVLSVLPPLPRTNGRIGAEPGTFLLPARCIFSPAPIQWEVRGAATAWPMPQATLRPCLEIFQPSGDKAPPLKALMAIG